jgi:hypothetical protein
MMFMRVMLIGLLVLGAVAMLETDASAQRLCGNWGCTFSFRRGLTEVKDSEAETDLVIMSRPPVDVQIIGRDSGIGRRRAQEVENKLIRLGLQPQIMLQPNPLNTVTNGVVPSGEVDVVIKPRP